MQGKIVMPKETVIIEEMIAEGSMCLDSWDHVPMRSWPLFKARQVLRTLFQSDLSLVA